MRKQSLVAAMATAVLCAWTTPVIAHTNGSPDINRELIVACASGQIWRVRYLVENGANVNYRDEQGYTPMTFAAQHGQATVIDYLISRYAQVNPVDKSGFTPLMWTAQEGHVNALETLLKRGANTWVLDPRGANAMTIARWAGNERVYSILRDAMTRTVQVNQKMSWTAPVGVDPQRQAMPTTASSGASSAASFVPAAMATTSTGWITPGANGKTIGWNGGGPAAASAALTPASMQANAPQVAPAQPIQPVAAQPNYAPLGQPGLAQVPAALPQAAGLQVAQAADQEMTQSAPDTTEAKTDAQWYAPGYVAPNYATPGNYGVPYAAPGYMAPGYVAPTYQQPIYYQAPAQYQPVVVNPPIYDKYQAFPLNKDHGAMVARKTWAISRMADESYRFRADFNSYVRATASHLGWETMGTLNDPDMEVGKYMNAMYAGLMKNRDLAKARRDLGRAKNIQDARGETLFSRYIIEADKILHDAGW